MNELAFILYQLCGRNWLYFVPVALFIFRRISSQGLIASFDRWGNWGLEKQSDLAKVRAWDCKARVAGTEVPRAPLLWRGEREGTGSGSWRPWSYFLPGCGFLCWAGFWHLFIPGIFTFQVLQPTPNISHQNQSGAVAGGDSCEKQSWFGKKTYPAHPGSICPGVHRTQKNQPEETRHSPWHSRRTCFRWQTQRSESRQSTLWCGGVSWWIETRSGGCQGVLRITYWPARWLPSVAPSGERERRRDGQERKGGSESQGWSLFQVLGLLMFLEVPIRSYVSSISYS